jgi:wyosine [tRNA(Phe)-imidazoG37] synthetase (radical SAM superfamily)
VKEIAGGGQKSLEFSPIHDFASKLCQTETLPRLKEYVRWQAFLRGTLPPGKSNGPPPVPDYAPVSINLDLTTACNFACDHCVDAEILNTGIRYTHDRLMDSLEILARKGLRSVIVIGGGEPTVYPQFTETVRRMKELGLQVSIVSNGSGMAKIAELVNYLEVEDWVRLSLDSGSDEVFQAMHRPKKPITLDQICEAVPEIRARQPRFKLGFSFVITWDRASINNTEIVENIHEIVLAAERARRYGFDYIAYKPFLTRAEINRAEIVDLRGALHYDQTVERIREAVEEAKKLESRDFKVYATTNLKVLVNGQIRDYTEQPHDCHMQFFRQVLSPLGIFNCPVYRNQPHGKIGDNLSYSTDQRFRETLESTSRLIHTFDATEQCKEVLCLYNHVNWWLEDLILHPDKLDSLNSVASEVPDFFL